MSHHCIHWGGTCVVVASSQCVQDVLVPQASTTAGAIGHAEQRQVSHLRGESNSRRLLRIVLPEGYP